YGIFAYGLHYFSNLKKNK
ncbi:hypothetical protein B8A12_05755, partial [Staphylococcus aureus]